MLIVIVMSLMIEITSMHVPLMAVAPSPVKRHCSFYSLDGPYVIMEAAWCQGMHESPY